jgi:hypothetical protein
MKYICVVGKSHLGSEAKTEDPLSSIAMPEELRWRPVDDFLLKIF